jgi:hypothetical protein
MKCNNFHLKILSLFSYENSKKKLQDGNSQDIYKTPNIMNKNIKEHPTGFMKWRQKLGNVNSDIQLVFKDSFFNMKFSDNFPS